VSGGDGIAFRVLGVGHVACGALLLPASLLFGVVAAPVLVVGPLWMMLLGVRLWRPDPRAIAALRRTNQVSLVIAVLLMAYGMLALRAAERSAAAGGGLLGGFGLLPLGAGVVLGVVAALSLVLAGRQSAD